MAHDKSTSKRSPERVCGDDDQGSCTNEQRQQVREPQGFADQHGSKANRKGRDSLAGVVPHASRLAAVDIHSDPGKPADDADEEQAVSGASRQRPLADAAFVDRAGQVQHDKGRPDEKPSEPHDATVDTRTPSSATSSARKLARWQRRAHPLAAAVFLQLRQRSEADRQLVHQALQRRLGVQTRTERQEQAAVALERFTAARKQARAAHTSRHAPLPRWAEKEPSRTRYEWFRAEQPEPKAWPSAQLIRNAFGTWQQALAAIGQAPAPDFTARGLLATGPAFVEGEALAALRLWVKDVDAVDPTAPLLENDYIGWAQRERGVAQPRLARIPNHMTVRRLLGSWPETLARLGLLRRLSPNAGVAGASAGKQAQPLPFDLIDIPANLGRPLTTEQKLDWLRWLGSKLGEAAAAQLTIEGFDSWRRQITWARQQENLITRIPAAQSIARDPGIGSWPKAKELAGLVGPATSQTRNQSRFADDRLVEAIFAAVDALGLDHQAIDFDNWRQQRLAELAEQGLAPRLPSRRIIRNRIGRGGQGWAEMLAEVLQPDNPKDVDDERR
jgi:hypothetical protein